LDSKTNVRWPAAVNQAVRPRAAAVACMAAGWRDTSCKKIMSGWRSTYRLAKPARVSSLLVFRVRSDSKGVWVALAAVGCAAASFLCCYIIYVLGGRCTEVLSVIGFGGGGVTMALARVAKAAPAASAAAPAGARAWQQRGAPLSALAASLAAPTNRGPFIISSSW
jgi:hypothetical protein